MKLLAILFLFISVTALSQTAIKGASINSEVRFSADGIHIPSDTVKYVVTWDLIQEAPCPPQEPAEDEFGRGSYPNIVYSIHTVCTKTVSKRKEFISKAEAGAFYERALKESERTGGMIFQSVGAIENVKMGEKCDCECHRPPEDGFFIVHFAACCENGIRIN